MLILNENLKEDIIWDQDITDEDIWKKDFDNNEVVESEIEIEIDEMDEVIQSGDDE